MKNKTTKEVLQTAQAFLKALLDCEDAYTAHDLLVNEGPDVEMELREALKRA